MESKKIDKSETSPEEQLENKESESSGMSLWVFRHGEWDFKNDQLTEKGRIQTKKAVENLLSQIQPGESIKFYSSPAGRAVETANIMIDEIRKKIEKENLNINLMTDIPRMREDLKQVRFDDEFDKLAQEAGYDKKDMFEFWYNMPEIEGIEKPEEVKTRFQGYIEKINKIVSRLKNNKSKINTIFITHGEVPTPILNEVFGVKGLAPANWLKMDFKAGELDSVRFSRATKSGQIESKDSSLKKV